LISLALPTVTHELIKLVCICRGATELHERVRFAEEIVVLVGPMLRRFVAARCAEAAVEDVLQEILAAIATGIVRFGGVSDLQFWGWCYGIAAHKVNDHLRRKSSPPTVSLDVEDIRRAVEAAAAESPIAPGDLMDLEWAMKLLGRAKAPCVGYLTSHYIEGLAYREIARLHDSTVNAIRMQIKRCLSLAQQLMADTP
jgi:DNA-directed RNA polymerase specialized sigma24 family protein